MVYLIHKMKRSLSIFFISILLVSCAPVLKKDVMNQGTFISSLKEIREAPAVHKGKLYIFGSIIVRTTATKEGSLVEGIFVPVNSRGYLKSLKASNGRFLAVYRGRELLDPLIFSEKREITLAGEFIERSDVLLIRSILDQDK